MKEQESELKEKKETYLLRLDKNLFFQISEYVQQRKKQKGRKNYSFNKFIIEALEKKISDINESSRSIENEAK